MDIRQISEIYKKSQTRVANIKEVHEMYEALYSSVEQSKKILLDSISEEAFVDFCRAVKIAVLSSCFSRGVGNSLVIADANGELDGLLDTYFLAVLGLLMQDEIV